MIANYIRLALRSLAKDKLRAGIEVLGLSIGLACCLLIMLFVSHEVSFDRFHSRADDLYRAWVKEDYGNDRVYFNSFTPIVLKETMDLSVTGLEATVRLGVMSDVVRHGDQSFTSTVHLADPDFLQVFDFNVIDGDPATALGDPGDVVLTRETAERLFARADAVGETVEIRFGDHFETFQVSAVTENPPLNSSIRYDMVVPFVMAERLYPTEAHSSWFSVMVETYVLLSPGADPGQVEAQFPGMMKAALGGQYERSNYSVGLQPLTDIHLNVDVPSALAPVSDPAYSYILSGIALLILLIACINYMTLSIGRSSQRAVEVGVRKSIGADRRHLMRQFWGEAILTTLIALGIGLTLAESFRPLFGELSGVELGPLLSAKAALFSVALCALAGLMAGWYPAAVLSGFKPVEVLKGKVKIAGDRSLVRRGLLTFQFSLSVFLIAATLTMGRQFAYLQDKPLGYDKEQVVVVPMSLTPNPQRSVAMLVREGIETSEIIRQDLASEPGVISTATASHAFGEGWTFIGFRDEADRYHEMHMNAVDEEYLETLGIAVSAGRGFSREVPSDRSRAVVVNEALVREFGLENPIGARLPGRSFPDHEIIGVVQDFHYESLHGRIRPLVLVMDPDLIFEGASDVGFSAFPTPRLLFRVGQSNVSETLDAIERSVTKVIPDLDYTFTFVDAAVDAQYRQERRLGEIVRIAAILAIVIACLGLFGLAGLAVVRRTKEIGVRKVLGASASRVFWLLSKDFGWMVAVSTLVAAPIAFLVLDGWLNDFAYRIALSPDLFILAGVIVLVIALLTVTYQGIRAAQMDPVKSLRYE